MASNKKLVSTLVGTLKDSINDESVQNRNGIAQYSVSSESMDSMAREGGQAGVESLGNIVDSTIGLILGNEEFAQVDFTAAQVNAAKSIAALALNPQIAMGALQQLKDPEVQGESHKVSVESIGIEDYIEPATLSNESFDGQAISNAVYFSIAYNLMAAKQDAFGEAFFPTIAIDPMTSGIAIETEFTSLYTSFERGIDGKPDKKKFNKTPIIKAIYDNDIFGVDKNKVVVVKRDENAAMLLNSQAFIDKTAGVEIETAPILFGKEVGLLGMSQVESLLSKGIFDESDTLDRDVKLNKVYFSLTGDNDGDDSTDAVTEMFSQDVSILPHSNFTYSTQAHDKDLSLSFETTSFVLNTSSSKQSDGTVSGILAQLSPNSTIKLHVKISGDGNAAYGDVAVYGLVAELDSVIDAAGNVIAPTSSVYTTIKAVIDSIKLEGYTLDAWRTNSNLRSSGQTITSDKYTQIFPVPLRSGISVRMPINNINGNNNDSKLTSQIQTAGMRVSIDAVKTLVEYADTLHNVTNNGSVANVELMGVGRHHVNTYYAETNLDLSNFVDSTTSSERSDDIKAAIVGLIKDEVLKAYYESNYGVAHEVLRGGVANKVGVIIGTNPRIKNYLTGDGDTINIGSDFEAKIVATPNKAISDKIYITFGVFDSDRNTATNPLNFGNLAWAPTITTDVARTDGGATIREIHNIPRYAHFVNLPIMMVVNVTSIHSVLGKIAGYRKSI